MKTRSPAAERRRSSDDIARMRSMRQDGATLHQIAAEFGLHHTTVMHHLNESHPIGDNWHWLMSPHEIRTGQVMRASGASYAEIARALHHNKPTVQRTLLSQRAQNDVDRYFRRHPVPLNN